MDDNKKDDAVLQHLSSISQQLGRVEEKIDHSMRRAVIAGGISGAVAGALSGPLMQAAIDLAKAKLGG